MKLYADTPARRARQVLGDLFVLAWTGTWAWLGRVVHDTVVTLRAPADSLTSAGERVRSSLSGAAEQVSGIPGIGDGLRGWLESAASSGTTIRSAGASMASGVERLASLLGWVTALVPILVVGGIWLLRRWRFVRRASSAQRFLDSAEDLDLFALRALARQPMATLAAISPDPAGDWRRGDPGVVRALAALELRDEGLRLP
ncbi:MAG TPA: hypothetical protein VFJ94_06825 [Intrasporangium sp.]|uniref:hypothetical protein n=1 Tax=Intrasporangium sp. TaxID=1925024 RepID=UPI002D782288|nr:hypothetical protein [Intrasporangium sp.]HET7398219.1 hypothetical protein [Intrasporangium sp.]